MPKRGGGQCPRPAFYCGTAAGDGPPSTLKSHARGTGKPDPGRRTPPDKPRQKHADGKAHRRVGRNDLPEIPGRNPPGGFRITCSQAR